MKFLQTIIEGFVGFVMRNPLLVLILFLIGFGAPSVVKGIALFILYTCLSVFILFAVFAFWFNYKIRKAQRRMGRQFEQQGAWGYRTTDGRTGGGAQGGFGGFSSRPKNPSEGEVRVHHTGPQPEKRISDDVGDYVDFEETKQK